MIKIGVGPSSSHTLGPWKAARRFVLELRTEQLLRQVDRVQVHLYGSLALTGVGHGTDKAVQLGLMDLEFRTIDTAIIEPTIEEIKSLSVLHLGSTHDIAFSPARDIVYHFDEALEAHANGMTLVATGNGFEHRSTFYSVGGGFIVKDGETEGASSQSAIPFPNQSGAELSATCRNNGFTIAQMCWENEQFWRSKNEVEKELDAIWETMVDAIYRGCHRSGELPGGLHVKRRAKELNDKLMTGLHYTSKREWLKLLRYNDWSFQKVLKWVSCFALAVNEENAAFGRIVTAPTNGAAGVIPAVLMYFYCFSEEKPTQADIRNFIMVAGEIGTYYKKHATISAAMGGCQAEIGVSSSMAAAALCECSGGTVDQALMAAEIAMEHHLGMTCDPIGGLVQIPCIERNMMGAVKAITAAKVALDSDPSSAKVSFDKVIDTMWQTARDMNLKYKETSQGGLAANISVQVPEC
jgi:L-serine dehydratase